jgi:hypothetical protein
MAVYQLNPVRDERWPRFVERHPCSSIFHTRAWQEALGRTYGYDPVVFTTTSPEAELTNGIVGSRVNSWLTGRRLVSTPFADHCDPLVKAPSDYAELLDHLESVARTEKLRYAEVRMEMPEPWPETQFGLAKTFAFHRLDLRLSMDDLFMRFHKAGIQRKVRRAEREGLVHEMGRSDLHLRNFYDLLTMTRRRHGLPPQPLEWFQQLRRCFGGALSVHVAFKNQQPVASILTLTHKDTLFYKYGGSDAAHHSSGAMPYLFWAVIRLGQTAGLSRLDLGRSDLDNPGLITFKERLGATPSILTYLRFPAPRASRRKTRYVVQIGRQLVRVIPNGLLVQVGRLAYRHAG